VTKGRSKTSVWWGAAIISIGKRGAKSRSATVQYKARHGYEATASNVCFKTERELVTIESGGKRERHLWRCVDTTSSQIGGTPSVSILQSTVRQLSASHNSDVGSSPERCELGQYRSLALRVGELEWLFQRRAPHNAGSFCARETDSERPLAFLRHKVGMELEKSVGGTVASARKHTEAHAVVQQTFQIDADCTLAEFKVICRRSRNLEMSAGQLYFYPSYPSGHSSRLRTKYEAFIPSYTFLCNILGVFRNEDIGATVKRTRVERRSETLLLVRIIGSLLKPGNVSGDSAMALAVSKASLPASICNAL
jgi:hypothetical protein